MREFFFECPILLLQFLVIETKCLILRAKNCVLRFERRVLIVGKRNALLEYGRRAMLVDKFFKPVEKSHVVAPNAALSRAGHGHDRKRCAVSPRRPRTRSYA